MIWTHQRFVWHSSHLNSQSRLQADQDSQIPMWNELTRELIVEGQLVKKYRGRAENQELILSAFQGAHWSSEIPVPSALRGKAASTQKLRIALDGLNRIDSMLNKPLFELTSDRLLITWRLAAVPGNAPVETAATLLPKGVATPHYSEGELSHWDSREPA